MRYNKRMSNAPVPQRLSDSDFVQQEKLWLALADQGDTDPIDVDALRIWLDQAPGRLEQTSLAAWTSLGTVLVWRTQDETTAHPEDVRLSRAVLDHALTVPIHVWMAEGPPLVEKTVNPDYVPNMEDGDEDDGPARPAYDALRSFLGTLSFADAGQGPSSIFMGILASGWEPAPLLHHLDHAREIQALYVENENSPKTSTAQAFLIEAALSAMGTSAWRPSQHTAWSMLWNENVHAYYQPDEGAYGPRIRSGEQRRAAAAALETFPQYAGMALNAYLTWPKLRRSMNAADMFPFPFEHSCDANTLETWVRCWQNRDNNSIGAKTACHLLEQHHPQIAHLLDMHCSLYTTAHDARRNATNIMESFQHLVGGKEPDTLSIGHLDLGL